ncbi:MAG TPA: magnesium-translocating P-type ATPase [Ktedonobacterales bacterium]|nr:magnesium-translocating P-type ATPase [Ktedonobacterales bacterium]
MRSAEEHSIAGASGDTRSDLPAQWGVPGRSVAHGLTTAEAKARLAQVGPNEPARARRLAPLTQLVQLMTNPLVVILLLAALVSAAVGERVGAVIIVVMVALSIALNFTLSYRSQRAAEELKAQVALTATALRDGQWREVPRSELVPGDVIRLAAGDMIPADAHLLTAQDLHVQQAALTGEALPVQKEAPPAEEGAPSAQAFAGGEHARGEAISPDMRDRVFLGTSVVSGTATAVVTATGRLTAFGEIAARLAERAPETEFDRGIRRFGFLITRTIIFLVFFVFLLRIAAHRDPFESLLFAVALAVGLTPEFLPMITTVTLAQGALRMAREKVIVKNLEAIQNFGSMDVLCSDKTGTLTSAEMTLERVMGLDGRESAHALELAAVNSALQTGIKSPLDTAILRAAPALKAETYTKLGELPFDFERRRLSVVVQSGSQQMLITKGAPEGILPLCSAAERDGHTEPMDAQLLAQCRTIFEQLDAQGARVLAIAYRTVPAAARYTTADERGLVLSGFAAFVDPPLPDAAASLSALRRDGVEVKILTGDSERVAVHICMEVGLDAVRMVTGAQIEHLSETALGQLAERTTIFARVSPAQKQRILAALKSRGHVVGFLGDGINDAPSLHVADVGISVAAAADVAKDAAQIILLERGLGVLHSGILAGRRAFGNVMKYLLMGTSSNFGNMFSMAAASLVLPFLPMLPTQILLNNFLYDLAQVTIPTDNVDESFMRKPHHWDISLIRNFMLFIGPISSLYDFLTFAILLLVFHASEALFHTGWFVESLATQTLVVFVIRTAGNPFRSRPSRALTITVLAVVMAALILPYTPLAVDLGFVPLPALYFGFLAVMTITYLGLVQVAKGVLMRHAAM